MLIVYGLRSTDGTPRTLHGETCPSCESPSISAFTRFTYFHVYWLPFIPTGREALVTCSTCNGTFTRRSSAFDPASTPQAFSPFHFTGLALAAALVLFFAIVGPRHGSASWSPPTHADPNQLAFVLLSEPRLPSAAEVIGAYADFGLASDRIRDGSLVVDPDDGNAALSLTLGDDDQALIALMPAPVPDGEAERMAAFSFSFMREGCELSPHTAHLAVLLRGSPNVSPLKRISRFTALLAAVVTTAPAVAVYWAGARATHDAAFFTSMAAKPGVAPRALLWTGLCVSEEPDGRFSLLSLGMDQLDLPDLFLTAPESRQQQTFHDFFNFLGYVASRGDAIPDGDTVGFTDDEQLPVHYVTSPVDPERTVCRIDLK